MTRSRGALLQWKRGWPWIFEPTNGPPERLSYGVCLTWACQKHLRGQVAVDVKVWGTGVLFIHTQELNDQVLVTGEALI